MLGFTKQLERLDWNVTSQANRFAEFFTTYLLLNFQTLTDTLVALLDSHP